MAYSAALVKLHISKHKNATQHLLGGEIDLNTEMVSGEDFNVFDFISGDDQRTGGDRYACFYIYNGNEDHEIKTVGVHFDPATEADDKDVELGIGTAAQGADEQCISDGGTSPSGVAFNRSDGYTNRRDVGVISPESWKAIWVHLHWGSGIDEGASVNNDFSIEVTFEEGDQVGGVIVQDLVLNSEILYQNESAIDPILNNRPETFWESDGLTLGTRTEVFHASTKAGAVSSQSLPGGSSQSPGTTIDWEVSKGPVGGFVLTSEMIFIDQLEEIIPAFPPITGGSFQSSRWRNFGFVVGTKTTSSHATIAAGNIISHTGSDGATTMNFGDTIDYVVSTGP